MSDAPEPNRSLDGDQKAELIEAVVARGTVVWDGPDGHLIHSTPGQTVKLPPDEVKRFRASGVLVDPDKPALPFGLGPTWETF